MGRVLVDTLAWLARPGDGREPRAAGCGRVCGEEAPFAPCFFSKYCQGSFQHPSVGGDPEAFVDFMVDKVKELKPENPNEPFVLMPVHKETWLIAEHRERLSPRLSFLPWAFCCGVRC